MACRSYDVSELWRVGVMACRRYDTTPGKALGGGHMHRTGAVTGHVCHPKYVGGFRGDGAA